MTGLDVDNHTLIEAAIIITNGNLKIIAESPNIIIHQPDEVLENMEDWPKKQHELVIIKTLNFLIYPYNWLFKYISIKSHLELHYLRRIYIRVLLIN